MYTTKQRWYSRLKGDNVVDSEYGLRMTVPRSGFGMTSISLDMSRKQNTMERYIKLPDGTNSELTNSYMRVPYNFQFELYSIFKQMDDGLQYVEQILPYFTPYFNLPINEIPELDIVSDIPLIFSGIQQEIPFEGGKDADIRFVQYTLSFDLKGYLYHPVKQGKIVTKSLMVPWVPNVGWTDAENVSERTSTAQYQQLVFDSVEGDFTRGETIYVGLDHKNIQKEGLCLEWNSATKTMTLVSVHVFEQREFVKGLRSSAQARVLDFDENITSGDKVEE